jgi:hypothetical protein
MEVTEIILAQVSRLCQLTNHSHACLSRLQIFLAHKTPFYDTKKLLKVIDKTVFVKFKISNNFQQNIDKTHLNHQKSIGKSIPAYGFKKSQEKVCEPKVSRLLPNVCDF